jgi:hypothetical protein
LPSGKVLLASPPGTAVGPSLPCLTASYLGGLGRGLEVEQVAALAGISKFIPRRAVVLYVVARRRRTAHTLGRGGRYGFQPPKGGSLPSGKFVRLAFGTGVPRRVTALDTSGR